MTKETAGMAPSRAPTVRQQRLGIELRRLREEKGMTADEIAERLEWSPSKLSRIENARIGVRVSDVRLLLELYQVEESHRGEVLALSQVATEKGWWANYSELLDKDLLAFIALEDEADSALYCEARMIPGLLQTEEYARHVIESWNKIEPASPQTIDRRVDVRMRRQRLLTKPHPLRISAIIDEAALLRCVGDREVMYRQLAHLGDVVERPNIELRVLPLDIPRGAGMAESFMLLEFSSSYDVSFPDVTHIESIMAIHTQNDSLTYVYRRVWNELAHSALDRKASQERIRAIAQDRWS
jgi:transcriptional regulator with XRE-family HTH domain